MPNARTIATALVLLQLIGGCAGGNTGSPGLTSATSPGASPLLTSSTAAVHARPAPPATCAVTVAETPFVPPPPYASQPPAAYGTRWYGSAQLWTELDRGGDVWWALPHNTAGYAQKTFWWAVGYSASSEPQPAIVVTGRQLDGAGTFRAGDPGTNAIFDGTESMLVGVDVPTAGCWMITGSYRGARLSYVVWVSSG